jgi:hypothetical protein
VAKPLCTLRDSDRLNVHFASTAHQLCSTAVSATSDTPPRRLNYDGAMACKLDLTNHAEYLHVVVSGDNTLETMRTYTTEIPKACMQFKKSRVLVVVELTGPELSMLNVYEGVRDGSDNAAALGMKVAYVDENPSHSIDNMMLAENVARGRGIPCRTFRDRIAAKTWLLSDEDD